MKKILLVLLVACAVSSCGKEGCIRCKSVNGGNPVFCGEKDIQYAKDRPSEFTCN